MSKKWCGTKESSNIYRCPTSATTYKIGAGACAPPVPPSMLHVSRPTWEHGVILSTHRTHWYPGYGCATTIQAGQSKLRTLGCGQITRNFLNRRTVKLLCTVYWHLSAALMQSNLLVSSQKWKKYNLYLPIVSIRLTKLMTSLTAKS